MKILITNDDGYKAEGIHVLRDTLQKEHDVFTIAPAEEKSACSNAFTIRGPLNVEKITDTIFAVQGYPADCVSLGIRSNLIPEPDIVISGINHGPNLGDDIFFSGTVAGARTAYIFGKGGIAVSIDSYHEPTKNFIHAAQFILAFIEEFKDEIQQGPLLYNINHPDLPAKDIKGVEYTYTCRRHYNDRHVPASQRGGKMEFLLDGSIESDLTMGSDAYSLSKGYISITPLAIDCTDYLDLKNILKSRMNN